MGQETSGGPEGRIDVALLPGQKFDAARSVCVVVDVLRASSSIVTLLERGCSSVVAAPTTDRARHLRTGLPDHLLCGEERGLPPHGFDYGNSPSEFSRLDLSGRSAILATSNGTRVLAAIAADSPAVLVGALLNRTAVARAAIDIARQRGLGVTVVCSAAHGGGTFVLEDALGAGLSPTPHSPTNQRSKRPTQRASPTTPSPSPRLTSRRPSAPPTTRKS
ncbi:MAG: 2-phosphosulfolactate phosphatase [Chloroflexi bacterium]|nr:2-phosphosulfolactate phosphatase [Chloroflexota bacterium]